MYYSLILFFVALYRLSPFHPLASYPGPLLPRISRFYLVWVATSGKQHLWYQDLHEQYGSFVRVGPNEISVSDVDVALDILGPKGMPRGPMYEGRSPPNSSTAHSLVTTLNPSEHARRRKAWMKAFSTNALQEHEIVVFRRTEQLLSILERFSNHSKEIDLAYWFRLFSFDTMADITFGGGFELMRDGDKDRYLELIHASARNIAFLEHVPWLGAVVQRIPYFTRKISQYRQFATKTLLARMHKGSARKDLFHYLLHEERELPKNVPLSELASDAFLAITAGSDTTSTTLATIFFYILTHEEVYTKLKAEVDDLLPPSRRFDDINMKEVNKMNYLTCVIHESLRLHPPVASRLQRASFPVSAECCVGNRIIPGGTAVQIPAFTIQRDQKYFSPDTSSFIPERWLRILEPEKPESVSDNHDRLGRQTKFNTNASAFLSFLYGPTSCVGKNLAMLEMRMVIVRMIQRFNMRLAHKLNKNYWDEERKDFYIAHVGRLVVTLERRY
ncbi:high nitrogen upregulated cytochrome P450 monooxygenase 2 [Fomitiporia mediterranea MF3/22]|uniref:high nitrogen upregulated cytochrome P450 monooxygenase 2 n=1 Tax=Fomitiporia mediterranea (strain MF3/22) TaxID=694068 RepID=UPI00044081C1|nr:high nitrogen upregulated cytochrome P450 monooxygenase 2 [Fomitiporia mediterranea MF3/22]EJD00230.1 high nitrogen upregulated cytochrome P450 monooxygenase 2 [Fomitiporia mediterranea MF3/22]